MTTWFTADLHFGHRNIIDYCDRPFADVEAMNRALIDDWNQTASESDTVWVLDEVVQDSVKIAIDCCSVLACHFPYSGDSHDEDRHEDHRPADLGDWLLHGHVHERWARRGRMINVGVDVTGFRPISEHDISAMI